jgi:tRNA A37 methylthiotransferase MiaB
MNVNDAEIVWSILQDKGYTKTNSVYDADVALLITCAIRDSAENKVWTRIKQIRSVKRWRGKLEPLKVGILGKHYNYFNFIYNCSCPLNFN